MSEQLPPLALSHAGVMRGAGRQLLASILNLITYWVLGLPLAILLGVYFNLGVEGLWWALLITTSVQVSSVTHAEPDWQRRYEGEGVRRRQPARSSTCVPKPCALGPQLQQADLCYGCLQGLAMLITVSIFNWRAEAKRAMMLLDQHERAVDGEEGYDEFLHDEVAEPQRS